MADVQVDLARYLIQLRADPDARDDKVRGDVFVTSIRVHSFLLASGCAKMMYFKGANMYLKVF